MKMFPEVIESTGKSEEDIKAVEKALKAAQNALPDSLFELLVESIERRIEACIIAKEQYTKYQKLDFSLGSWGNYRYIKEGDFP